MLKIQPHIIQWFNSKKGLSSRMLVFGLLALLAFSRASPASITFHPLSDEYIDNINSLQTTWTAGRNFHRDTPMTHIKRLLGAVKNDQAKALEMVQHVKAADEAIPGSFDARQNWPDCESIRTIRDQSNCGSCWAVAAAAVMSDRICISSNGADQTLVSDEDLTSCCTDCGYGCEGGFSHLAWEYWRDIGIVSGGPYDSRSKCKPYSMQPCEHYGSVGNLPNCSSLTYETPKCIHSCNDGSPMTYEDSRTFASQVFVVSSDVEQIQLEIMRNGPVEAGFDVYSDFISYKNGVYKQITGDYLGGHDVRIIGWGIENDIPYWLITNSWNEDWGDRGTFKILRGKNHCNIETTIMAGRPRL